MKKDSPPNGGGSRIRWFVSAWAATVAVAVIYAFWLQGSPDTRSDIEFYLWAASVSAGTSLLATFTMARGRYLVLAFLASSAAGFGCAYCLALLTYGSPAEDGTVWRGIGGAVLGAISAIAAWVMVRLGVYRSDHARLRWRVGRVAPAHQPPAGPVRQNGPIELRER